MQFTYEEENGEKTIFLDLLFFRKKLDLWNSYLEKASNNGYIYIGIHWHSKDGRAYVIFFPKNVFEIRTIKNKA